MYAQKQAKQQEEQETEEMINSAFTGMKSGHQNSMGASQKIKLENDMEYVTAFGT